MKKTEMKGTSSLFFTEDIYIESCASIVSQKEGEGPLGNSFDIICEDPMFGADTWEAAESTMQKETAGIAIKKAGLTPKDICLVFAGDLLAQTAASSFGIAGMSIPFYGLYGACSTMGEALSLGAVSLAAGYESIFSAPPQATLPVQKRNSVSLWVMEISVLILPLGRLPEAEPAFLEHNRRGSRTAKPRPCVWEKAVPLSLVSPPESL